MAEAIIRFRLLREECPEWFRDGLTKAIDISLCNLRTLLMDEETIDSDIPKIMAAICILLDFRDGKTLGIFDLVPFLFKSNIDHSPFKKEFIKK
jgi:hypothetical protein